MKYKKRKDRKGRILKPGESQRENGTYQFRYTDVYGERQYVYAKTLDELREKEEEINKALSCGIDYSKGDITVIELVERYLPIVGEVRYNTKVCHNFVLNLLKKEDFCYRKIRDIKISDAKAWILKLHSINGYKRNTISSIKGVVKPAFEMAFQDNIIARNPFAFTMNDVHISDDSTKRKAMTKEEQEKFMSFIMNDKIYSKYYDECVILLETGIRVSELYGLTVNDIDFKNKVITVNHQLLKERNGRYFLSEPKTDAGNRLIPMTDVLYRTLKRVISNRITPKVEMIVDGHSGFLFLDRNQMPKVALHLQHAMKRALDKYNKANAEHLTKITPHVFRHTFCTNMALAKIGVKDLQYLMGHEDAETTLNVYSDNEFDSAKKAMGEIVHLVEADVG